MNVGDIITGIDRSYERSIYEVKHIVDDRILAIPISLAGYVFKKRQDDRTDPIGFVSEFRLATEEEVVISSSGPCEWKAREKWLEENHGIVFNLESFPLTIKRA